MIDDQIYERLSTYQAVTDVVSPENIFMTLAPDNQAASPYIVFQQISDVPTLSLENTIAIRTARYQVSCYAQADSGGSMSQLRQLKEAVIAALQGYTTESISAIEFDSALDTFEPDTRTYHIPIDFLVTYQQ